MSGDFQSPAEVLAWVEPLLASAQTKLSASEAQNKVKESNIEALQLHTRKLEHEIASLQAQKQQKPAHREWELVENEVRGLGNELKASRDALAIAHGAQAEADERRIFAEERCAAAEQRCAALEKKNELLEGRLSTFEEDHMEKLGESMLSMARASKLEVAHCVVNLWQQNAKWGAKEEAYRELEEELALTRAIASSGESAREDNMRIRECLNEAEARAAAMEQSMLTERDSHNCLLEALKAAEERERGLEQALEDNAQHLSSLQTQVRDTIPILLRELSPASVGSRSLGTLLDFTLPKLASTAVLAVKVQCGQKAATAVNIASHSSHLITRWATRAREARATMEAQRLQLDMAQLAQNTASLELILDGAGHELQRHQKSKVLMHLCSIVSGAAASCRWDMSQAIGQWRYQSVVHRVLEARIEADASALVAESCSMDALSDDDAERGSLHQAIWDALHCLADSAPSSLKREISEAHAGGSRRGEMATLLIRVVNSVMEQHGREVRQICGSAQDRIAEVSRARDDAEAREAILMQQSESEQRRAEMELELANTKLREARSEVSVLTQSVDQALGSIDDIQHKTKELEDKNKALSEETTCLEELKVALEAENKNLSTERDALKKEVAGQDEVARSLETVLEAACSVLSEGLGSQVQSETSEIPNIVELSLSCLAVLEEQKESIEALTRRQREQTSKLEQVSSSLASRPDSGEIRDLLRVLLDAPGIGSHTRICLLDACDGVLQGGREALLESTVALESAIDLDLGNTPSTSRAQKTTMKPVPLTTTPMTPINTDKTATVEFSPLKRAFLSPLRSKGGPQGKAVSKARSMVQTLSESRRAIQDRVASLTVSRTTPTKSRAFGVLPNGTQGSSPKQRDKTKVQNESVGGIKALVGAMKVLEKEDIRPLSEVEGTPSKYVEASKDSLSLIKSSMDVIRGSRLRKLQQQKAATPLTGTPANTRVAMSLLDATPPPTI